MHGENVCGSSRAIAKETVVGRLVQSDGANFVHGTGQSHLLVPGEVPDVEELPLAVSEQEAGAAAVLRLVRLFLLGVLAERIGSTIVDVLGQQLAIRGDNFPL